MVRQLAHNPIKSLFIYFLRYNYIYQILQVQQRHHKYVLFNILLWWIALLNKPAPNRSRFERILLKTDSFLVVCDNDSHLWPDIFLDLVSKIRSPSLSLSEPVIITKMSQMEAYTSTISGVASSNLVCLNRPFA